VNGFITGSLVAGSDAGPNVPPGPAEPIRPDELLRHAEPSASQRATAATASSMPSTTPSRPCRTHPDEAQLTPRISPRADRELDFTNHRRRAGERAQKREKKKIGASPCHPHIGALSGRPAAFSSGPVWPSPRARTTGLGFRPYDRRRPRSEPLEVQPTGSATMDAESLSPGAPPDLDSTVVPRVLRSRRAPTATPPAPPSPPTRSLPPRLYPSWYGRLGPPRPPCARAAGGLDQREPARPGCPRPPPSSPTGGRPAQGHAPSNNTFAS